MTNPMNITEARRLSAHVLLKAAMAPVTDEIAVQVAYSELRDVGVIDDREKAEPLAQAALFLVNMLFTSFAEREDGMGKDVLLLVMKQQVDEHFLPGGDAPSPN